MGGKSTVSMQVERVGTWLAWRLQGHVTLENDGGFAQLSSTVAEDWSGYVGLRVRVCGDGGTWWLSLRTAQVRAPWQSWRAPLTTTPGWQTVDVPWRAFSPHRIEGRPDLMAVRRLALLSVGRETDVDVALASVALLVV
jgi:hypothetical protein